MSIYKSLNEQRLENLEKEIYMSILEEGVILEADIEGKTETGHPIKLNYYCNVSNKTSHPLRIKIKDRSTGVYTFPVDPNDGHITVDREYVPNLKRVKLNDLIAIAAGLAATTYKCAREYYGYKDKKGIHPANPEKREELENQVKNYFKIKKSERRAIQSAAKSNIEYN